MELPFWMVWSLRGRGRIEAHLPKTWSASQRSIIIADADVVDLVKNGLFFRNRNKEGHLLDRPFPYGLCILNIRIINYASVAGMA